MNILMLARWLPVPWRHEEARREYRFARRLLELVGSGVPASV